MKTFTFTATDGSGVKQQGRVAAESEQAAAETLTQRGLRPITIHPVNSAQDDRAASLNATGQAKPSLPPDLTARPTADISLSESHASQPRSLIPEWLPLALSGVAVSLSLFVLLWVFVHDPLGPSLARYDFSSPENALRSLRKIELDGAVRAQIQLTEKRQAEDAKEALDSLSVEKTVTFGGKTILFVTYQKKGKKKRECVTFEKDKVSTYWLPDHLSHYSVEKDDPGLAQQMKAWEN